MMSVYGCKTKKELKARVGQSGSGRFMETSAFEAEYKPDGTFCMLLTTKLINSRDGEAEFRFDCVDPALRFSVPVAEADGDYIVRLAQILAAHKTGNKDYRFVTVYVSKIKNIPCAKQNKPQVPAVKELEKAIKTALHQQNLLDKGTEVV